MRFNGRVLFIANVIMLLVVFMVACGGGRHMIGGGGGGSILPPPGSTLPTHLSFSATPGAALGKGTVLSSSNTNFDLVPTVHAQAVTVPSFAQSWSGFCSSFGSFRNTDTEFVIYGLGQLDPTCATATTKGVPASQGADVVGAGTLHNLIVTATGTGASEDSGTINVYLNGVRQNFVGKLGINPTRQLDLSTLVPTADMDKVAVTLSVGAGDDYHNVQVLLGKDSTP